MTISRNELVCKWLRLLFWSLAIALGAADAWASRFSLNSDGLSYLDIGDAYWRGDWHMAVNAYWSPLYSWILGLALKALKPSEYWQYPLLRAVNFLIYVAALACFEFFLNNFLRCLRRGPEDAHEMGLPEWALRALGYSLFIWISLILTSVGIVTPDMCVAACVYLACGLLLQVRAGIAGRKTFVLLGVVLGLGYLAKAVVFPLAFVFLGAATISLGSLRTAVRRGVVTVLVFLVFATPFMAAVSIVKGRLTFGETGRLNYAASINDVDILYPGDSGRLYSLGEQVVVEGLEETESSVSKELLHPVRRIFQKPATYQFDGSVGGTYPFWYNPSYWQEGLKPHFDLRAEAAAVRHNVNTYFSICLQGLRDAFLGLCILYLAARKRWSCIIRAAANWPLVVPGAAGLGLYGILHIETRYVAPFILLLWMAAFSGVRISRSRASQWLIALVSVGCAASMLSSAGAQVRQRWALARITGPVYWQAATALQRLGIGSGDKLAVAVNWPNGESVPFVARLVKARVDAQVNRRDQFFAAPPTVQTKVLQVLAAGGVKALVTQDKPPNGPPDVRWEELGLTYFYVCRTSNGSAGAKHAQP
jgi:hypothetical protein